MQDGKRIELLATEKGLLVKGDDNKSLEKGDVIQYKTNTKNEISTIRVLLDISKKDTQFEESPATDMNVIYGKVTAKFPSSMNITVNDGAEKNIAFGDAKIYLVDNSKSSNIVVEATTGRHPEV